MARVDMKELSGEDISDGEFRLAFKIKGTLEYKLNG